MFDKIGLGYATVVQNFVKKKNSCLYELSFGTFERKIVSESTKANTIYTR